MKLVLSQPSPWPVHELARGPADLSVDPAIVIGRFEPAEGTVDSVVQHAITLERPAFASASVLRATPGKSDLEWQVQVVESTLAEGSRIIERRLTYIYFFFEWAVAVIFRASPEQFVANAERAVAVLESGRPDWSAGVVALHQLVE